MAQAALNALRLFGVAAAESGQTTTLAEGTTLTHYRALAAIVHPCAYSTVNLVTARCRVPARARGGIRPRAVLRRPRERFQSTSTLLRWLELHYLTLTEALAVIDGHAAARVSITLQDKQNDGDARKTFASMAADSLKLLRGQAAATVTLPRADSDEEDGVVARASFLIDTQRWQLFADTVSKESQRQPALDFHVTGPWPPYDFVRMQFGA